MNEGQVDHDKFLKYRIFKAVSTASWMRKKIVLLGIKNEKNTAGEPSALIFRH